MITYQQALSDRQYLWQTYGPAYDYNGAYIVENDLDKLLKSPTKRTATECLCDQIVYWYEAGPENKFVRDPSRINWEDPKIQEIAERHFITRPF